MRSVSLNTVLWLLMGMLFLQLPHYAYSQSNDEQVEQDTTISDLIISGDSSTVNSVSDEEVTVEVESDTALTIIDSVNFDIFKGPESVLRARLKKIENKVPLTCNPRIKGFINYFVVRNRKYSLIMERRRRLYFPIFEKTFKELGVPDELKYLAIVESGLNPRAISRVGAAGLWQFMPATGREFGLYIDQYIDERFDPYLSTVAAAKYLKQLNRIFDDWEFGISSYNCGPGNVRRSIRRSGYQTSFWGVYNSLPSETRGYLPQFVALMYTMNYLEQHDIVADSLEYPIAFDTIAFNQYINIEVFAKELNMSLDDFTKMNPMFLKNYFPGHRVVKVRIPSDKMVYYILHESDILDKAGKKDVAIEEVPLVIKNVSQKASKTPVSSSKTQKTKIYYTVKSGDVLGSIADKHGVSVYELKSWNHIKGTKIVKGQRLVIYKSGTKTGGKASALSGKPTYYKVRSGDNLWTIAKKFDMTVDQLKKLNNIKQGGSIQAGQRLKVK
jgi:membrane-bound lytic murein transglycosylase D